MQTNPTTLDIRKVPVSTALVPTGGLQRWDSVEIWGSIEGLGWGPRMVRGC